MEIFEAVDPRVVTAAVRQLPEDPQYLFNSILPDTPIGSIEFAIDDITTTNRAAHFRSFDAPVEIGQGPSFVRTTGEMPALGEGYLVGEYRRLLEERLRGSDIDGRLLELVLGYARRGVNAIRARMEVARGQLLSTGKFTLTNEGQLIGLEANFGVPGDNFVTPALDWDDPDANIVQDISDWTDQGVESSGIRPDTILAGRTAVAQALQNPGIRQLYGNAFGAAQQLSIGQVNQVLAAMDLPMFALAPDPLTGTVKAVRPTKVDVDGSTVDTFPNDAIALYPAGMIGRTLWGPTFEALELASTGMLESQEAPGIVAMAMRDGNPGQLFTLVNAVGLPVLDKPKALIIATDDAP